MSVARSLQYATGRTLNTVLRDLSTGSVRLWNTGTGAFEAYNAAHVANYGISTTEPNGTGTYVWTVPAALPATTGGNEYTAVTYDCAASSLAATDFPNAVWRSTFEWDGAAVAGLRTPVLATKTVMAGSSISGGRLLVKVAGADATDYVGCRVRFAIGSLAGKRVFNVIAVTAVDANANTVYYVTPAPAAPPAAGDAFEILQANAPEMVGTNVSADLTSFGISSDAASGLDAAGNDYNDNGAFKATDADGNPLATAAGQSTLSTAVTNLTNLSALANMAGPRTLEIPDSGTASYPFYVKFFDVEGHLVDLASDPTVTAANAAGTDRSSYLSSVTHLSTGVYFFTAAVDPGTTREGIIITAVGNSATDGTPRRCDFGVNVSDVDTSAAIADIQSKAAAIKARTDNLPADPASEANAAGNRDAVIAAMPTVPTAAQNAAAVLNSLNGAATVAQQLAHLDADVSAAGGTGTLVITPVQATVSNNTSPTRRLASISKGSCPVVVIDVTDGTGAAVDLSGKSLRMTFGRSPDDGQSFAGICQYTTVDGGLTVQGTGNNQVRVQFTTAFTRTAGVGCYWWWLWDITGGEDAKVRLVKGQVDVENAVESVPQ